MYQVKLHHDPVRQVNFLQESIQLGKKPLGVFLGAGCPLAIRVPKEQAEGDEPSGSTNDTDPLIPDLAKMTEIIIDNLQGSEHRQAIETLCSHFEGQRKKPTLEGLLGHLRALIDICGDQEVRGLSYDQMIKLEKEICEEIYNLVKVDHPNSTSPYHKLAEWVHSADREHNVEIFTTNYDLLMEQALETNRVPFFDGFIGSVKPFFDPYAIDEEKFSSRWAGLWKLHGSINWRYDVKGKDVFRSDVDQIADDERRLIHPSHLKYNESRRMPYLAMLDRLKAYLRRPSSLLITIGYSFADEHINEVIRQGLERNVGAHCFALAYGPIDMYPDGIKLAKSRSNFSLLANDKGVIGRKLAPYIEKFEGETGTPTPGIKWVQRQETTEGKTLHSQFCLGDFAEFGEFLEKIIGNEHLVKSYAMEEAGALNGD